MLWISSRTASRRDVLGPPDIEERVGLTGGHIFQGECLPDQMWERRFASRTPVVGLYLCGAATHPGGSVIAINGRKQFIQQCVVKIMFRIVHVNSAANSQVWKSGWRHSWFCVLPMPPRARLLSSSDRPRQ